MALEGFSATDYLRRLAAFWTPASRPVAVYIWGWRDVPNSDGIECTAWSSGEDGTTSGATLYNQRQDAPGNQIRVAERVGFTNIGLITGATPPSEAWYVVACHFVSATLREARVNDGSVSTNTTDATPDAAYDSFRVGVSTADSNPWTIGALAEVSVWDTDGFTEQERRDLDAEIYSGRNPLAINADVGEPWSGALIDLGTEDYAYASMRTDSDLGPFAMVGTVTEFASHPPVDPESSGTPVSSEMSGHAEHLASVESDVTVQAEHTGTGLINITVLDAEGTTPQQGETVVVVSQATGDTSTETTDVNGEATSGPHPLGDYDVYVRRGESPLSLAYTVRVD